MRNIIKLICNGELKGMRNNSRFRIVIQLPVAINSKYDTRLYIQDQISTIPLDLSTSLVSVENICGLHHTFQYQINKLDHETIEGVFRLVGCCPECDAADSGEFIVDIIGSLQGPRETSI